MLKRDVQIGGHYAIRHSNEAKLAVIRIDSECRYGGWNATKLKTGRTIRIKSAAKLRFEVELKPDWEGVGSRWRRKKDLTATQGKEV